MLIRVSSGDFLKVIDAGVEDRKEAHRVGCVYAVQSGKRLGRLIRSTIHIGDMMSFMMTICFHR
jgi:hypothetical protein